MALIIPPADLYCSVEVDSVGKLKSPLSLPPPNPTDEFHVAKFFHWGGWGESPAKAVQYICSEMLECDRSLRPCVAAAVSLWALCRVGESWLLKRMSETKGCELAPRCMSRKKNGIVSPCGRETISWMFIWESGSCKWNCPQSSRHLK